MEFTVNPSPTMSSASITATGQFPLGASLPEMFFSLSQMKTSSKYRSGHFKGSSGIFGGSKKGQGEARWVWAVLGKASEYMHCLLLRHWGWGLERGNGDKMAGLT
jgi:hypothetical protein